MQAVSGQKKGDVILISPSQYYEKNLYPLQDGVLDILSRSDTDFFLTGGTALSRGYYHHRYSDDLDFFLDRSQTYDEQLDKVLALLAEGGFSWDSDKGFVRAENFATIGLKKDSTILKLDFVNDLVPHFGGFVKTDLFHRTDSIRNILSNKLSAIFRYAAKDIADIREITLHEKIDWATVIREARQKEAGLDLIHVSEILQSMPESEFDTIAWIVKPDWEKFKKDIHSIVFNMLTA
jgi:predicted nucleotidyltransferase component of viral defense system